MRWQRPLLRPLLQHRNQLHKNKCPKDNRRPHPASARPTMSIRMRFTVSDFRIEDGEAKDEYGRTIIVPTCVECPAGQKPHPLFYDDFLKQINILQHPHVCAACPLLQKCPVRFASGWNLLRAASVRSLIAKLTKGGQAGQSALSFLTSNRRLVTFSTLLVA